MTRPFGPSLLLVPATFLAFIAGIFCSCACAGSGNGDGNGDDSIKDPYGLPDTLRAVTLYSPMSYFHYRDEVMGYDYNLLTDFVQSR